MTLITIRPANPPADYPAIAAVLAAEGWAIPAEELAYDDAQRSADEYHTTLVAEAVQGEAGQMVGVVFLGQDPLAHRPGKVTINLRVRTDWQGRGVGKALYAAALAELAPLQPTELWAFVWAAHPRTPRFLEERGFTEVWRRVDSYLDVTTFDSSPYAGLEEKLSARGIVIKTYAELATDPQRLVKLYELDWAIWQSIPYGQAVTKRSLAQFVAAEIDHPKFLADACFIAVQDGEFVGYSNLSPSEDGFNTEMTGVRPTHRGQGVATVLKLHGIRYTQAQGKSRLETQNDAVNTAMIALNQKLGFVPDGANLRFMKEITTYAASYDGESGNASLRIA
jgi:GNAT superfamily N-acetyltransferase